MGRSHDIPCEHCGALFGGLDWPDVCPCRDIVSAGGLPDAIAADRDLLAAENARLLKERDSARDSSRQYADAYNRCVEEKHAVEAALDAVLNNTKFGASDERLISVMRARYGREARQWQANHDERKKERDEARAEVERMWAVSAEDIAQDVRQLQRQLAESRAESAYLRDLLADLKFYLQRQDIRAIGGVVCCWDVINPVLQGRIDAATKDDK